MNEIEKARIALVVIARELLRTRPKVANFGYLWLRLEELERALGKGDQPTLEELYKAELPLPARESPLPLSDWGVW